MAPVKTSGSSKSTKRKVRDEDGPAIITTSTRSLDRLLSLDKDFEGFEERLEHAVRIAKIPAGWEKTEVPEQELADTATTRYHGRAEWVLRWLLDKLKSQEIVGTNARSSARAWMLLKSLVSFVPISNVARLLNASDFLSILEKTLENFTPNSATATGREKHAANSLSDPRPSMSDSSVTLDELPIPSRKRKRDSSNVGDGPSVKRPLCSTTMATLIDSISNCLRTIVLLSQSVDQEAVSCQHMKSVFKTDSTQAAQILRNWLLALVVLQQDRSGVLLSLNTSHKESLYLPSVIEIWNSRSITTDESNASASLFSSQCLVPSTILLSILADRDATTDPAAVAASEHDVIPLLHALLAKHLFLPARSAFFGSPGDSRVSSKPEKPQYAETQLMAYLEPLRNKIASTKEGIRIATSDQSTGAARRGLPLLFDIAVRCSPAPTPRRKIAERPWLQAVFVRLANCVELLLDDEGDEQSRQDESLSTLEALLQVAIDRKISLEENILESIIRRYTGLFGNLETTVRWTLIAKILALDPNVLIDSSGSRKAQTDSGATSKSITDTLFDKVSAEHADNLDDDIMDASYFSGTSIDIDDPSNLHPFRSPYGAEYEYIKASILIPLMRAFAHARDLNGFMSRWFIHLRKAATHIIAPYLGGSVWEDEDLAVALRPLLENSLTPYQISELLSQYAKYFSDLRELLQDGYGYDFIGSEAGLGSLTSLVLLDAVLSAVSSDALIEQLQTRLVNIHDELLVIGGNWAVGAFVLVSRVWRLLSRTYSMLLPFQDSAARELHGKRMLSSDCFKHARQAILDAGKRPSLGHFVMGYEAFMLIAMVCNSLSEIEGFQRTIREEMQELTTWLVRSSSLEHLLRQRDAANPRYPSRSRNTIREETLTLQMASGFVHFLGMLKYFTSESRRSMFTIIFNRAFGETGTLYPYARGFSDVTYTMLLSAISDHALTSTSLDIRDDYLRTLFTGLAVEKRNDFNQGLVANLIAFTEEMYMRAPVLSMTRKHREAVLDRVLNIVRAPNDSFDPSRMLLHLSLMVKLMEVPNATATILTDPEALWQLASCVGDRKDATPNSDIMAVVEEMTRLTLKHVISSDNRERSQDYLRHFVKHLQSCIDKTESFVSVLGTLSLVKVVLQSPYVGTFSTLVPNMESTVSKYLGILNTDLQDLQRGSDVQDGLESVRGLALVDAVAKFPSHIRSVTSDLVNLIVPASAQEWLALASQKPVENDPADLTGSLLVACYEVLVKHGEAGSSIPYALALLRRDLSAMNYQSALRIFRSFLSTWSFGDRATAVTVVLPQDALTLPSAEEIQLLHVILSSLDVNTSDTSDDLSGVFSRLCRFLPMVSNLRGFSLIVECIDLMLRDKTWLISQWGIDSLLSCLTWVTSPSGPVLPTDHADFVYLRLCDIAYTMVSLHRMKLRGRYHLLMPLLQALLGCLFTPDTRHSSNAASSYPPWLAPKQDPLGASHATAYTRVLTILCSPTASLVSTRSRHRNHSDTAQRDLSLTDETKKARAYAGQYVPVVLMQYCTNQLAGRLKPEARAALVPGLYAMMDVVGLEAMRALNAGMDASTRAIWSTLYREWKRFGQWKER